MTSDNSGHNTSLVSSTTVAPPETLPDEGKYTWLWICLVILALLVGSQFLRESKKTGPKIEAGTPAAQLLRDDSAKQAQALKELEAAQKGTDSRRPQLFLRSQTYNINNENELGAQVVYSIDYNACNKYAGSYNECRELFKSLAVSKEAVKLQPALPGDAEANKSSDSFTFRYTVPVDKIPAKKDGYKVKIARFPAHVNADQYDFTLSFPAWKITTSISKIFPNPDKQDSPTIQAIIKSSYPLDAAGFEKHFSLKSEEADLLIGTPEFQWTNPRTCVVTLPVDSLPAKDSELVLQYAKGFKRAQSNDAYPLDIEEKKVVADAQSYATVASIDLLAFIGEDGIAKPLLLVDFSVPVNAAQAQKAVSAKLLPLYKDHEDRRNNSPTRWTWDDVTEELDAGMPAVPLQALPMNEEYSTQVTFLYQAPASRYVVVDVKGDISTRSKYKFSGLTYEVCEVPQPELDLRLMQSGTIVSLAGSRKLALVSRGLDKIEWSAWRVRPEFLNMLAFRSDEFNDPNIAGYSIGMEDISEKIKGSIKLEGGDGVAPQYSSLDLGELMDKGARGIFELDLRGEGSADTKRLKRFVLLTDIGLIVKKGILGERSLFATSFSQGGPLAGATVKVIGRNGVPLMNLNCDANGKASIPPLDGFVDEKLPVALEVSYGSDVTYMLIREYDSSTTIPINQNWSGSDDASTSTGLKIFAFSERGIYRPGEKLHFGIIAKSPDWSAEPVKNLPVKTYLYDPTETLVSSRTLALNAEGNAEINIPTNISWRTGSYRLDISHADRTINSVWVQVEEFQPDRIKVKSRVIGKEAQAGKWLLPDKVTVEVSVQNLYGTPASDSVVSGRYTAYRTTADVINYKDYSFSSPTLEGAENNARNSNLGDKVTDKDGKVAFEIPLQAFVAGSYNVYFSAEAFEAGGGKSVYTSAYTLVSPFTQFIGWRSDAKLDFLAKDAEAVIETIAVGQSGQAEESMPLTLTITAIDNKSMLTRNSEGVYRYETQKHQRVVRDEKIIIPADGLKISLPTDMSGDFFLSLKDADGLVRLEKSFAVVGGADRYQGLNRDATLRIRLENYNYESGDELKVFISAPYAGTGLITVESDKVLGHSWFHAKTTDSVQSITVPEGFEGRAFIVVHMLRDMEAPEIYAKPSAVAAAPFVANLKRRDMKLSLESPEIALPGEEMKITIKSEKAGQAYVYAVDEGVLQLTRYKLPSPITFFLLRKNHEVHGWQNWNLLMPEYGLVQSEAKIGGDLDEEALKRMNPFRRKGEDSVVYWSGLVDVNPDGVELGFKVPSYFNGSLRIMAVGSGHDAVGETERKTIVRAPVVITPTVPLAVSPGDIFDVSVAIANVLKDSGKGMPVDFAVEIDDALKFESAPPTKLTVDEGDDQVLSFKLAATERLGESRIVLKASISENGEAKTIRREISLSVRPASPKISTFSAGKLLNDKQEIPVARDMYNEYAKVEAHISGLPLPLVAGLAAYLTEYPYGCTEQIISAAFPYVLLADYRELLPTSASSDSVIDRSNASVATLVRNLRNRQIRPGRFSLWPQQRETYNFLSPYVLDFLITAKKNGFNIPAELINNAAKECRTMLVEKPASLDDARLVAYAAFVHARSAREGFGERYKDLGAVVKNLDAVANWRQDVTAALMAGAYSEMLQQKTAESLINTVKLADPKGTANWFMSPLWANGLTLHIIAEYFPERITRDSSLELLISLVNNIGSGNYTSTGAVQAARGIVSYAAASLKQKEAVLGKGQTISITAFDKQNKQLPVAGEGDLVKKILADASAAKFLFTGGAGVYWQISSDGFDRTLAAGNKKSKIEVKTQFVPADGQPLNELKQGDEVFVIVSANTTDGSNIDNIAITSLLPGGFEQVISKGGVVEDSTSGRSTSTGEDGETAYADSALMDEAQTLITSLGLPNTGPMRLNYADRREDRMIIYTSLDKNERAYIYRIKAINKGLFTLPVTFGEALYDQDARARTSVGKIEVK